jgi:hypothetical protein
VTAPPEQKKEPDDDSLRKKLPPLHVAAQVASTLVCAFAMSFLGTAGTLAGLATGSLLSSTVPTLIEHTAGRSAKHARERYLHYRHRGLSPEAAHTAVIMERQVQAARRGPRRKLLLWTGVTAVLVAGLSLFALTSIEAAAGKPASAIVQGRTGSGTTLGGSSYTPPPSPVPSYSPGFTPTVSYSPGFTPTVSYTTAAASTGISPSALPSLSSSPSPSLGPSPSPSTSPSQTPGLSPSASPSPSGTPSSAQVPAGTQEPSAEGPGL